MKNNDETAAKLSNFLAQAFIIRGNEEISIPRTLLTRIHSVALTEIEHFTKEIIEQPEKCKHSESPPYGSCSNTLEKINFGIAEFLSSDLMNLKVTTLLEFKGLFFYLSKERSQNTEPGG